MADEQAPTLDGAENNTAATEGSTGTQAGAETEAQEDAKLYSKKDLEQRIESTLKSRLAQERRQAAKEAQQAGLPEVEKLKAQLEDSKVELQRYRAKDDFLTKARDAKLENPQKVYELYAGRLVFDDKGKCINLDEVVAGAKSDLAELLRSGDTSRAKIDASARSTGDASTGAAFMNRFIRTGSGR